MEGLEGTERFIVNVVDVSGSENELAWFDREAGDLEAHWVGFVGSSGVGAEGENGIGVRTEMIIEWDVAGSDNVVFTEVWIHELVFNQGESLGEIDMHVGGIGSRRGEGDRSVVNIDASMITFDGAAGTAGEIDLL